MAQTMAQMLKAHSAAELEFAAGALSRASEIAEQIGWPSLARDLAVAMVTAQKARSEFRSERTNFQTLLG